jgi:hypothetical protein
MQLEGTVVAPRLAGSVRGLGVCDVLRVELAPVQRPALDAQIIELQCRLGTTAEARRLLALMREGLPPRDDPAQVLSGPAGLVLELVDACMTDAVRRVARRLEVASRHGLVAAELEAARAWIVTALDCAAVEDFSFEPGADPVRAW